MELKVDTPALPTKIDERFSRYVYNTVMCLFRGKTNNIGMFEVLPNTTETKVMDSRVTPNCHISIIGLDNVSKSGVLSIIERNSRDGYFVVDHPSADTVRTFSYAVIG